MLLDPFILITVLWQNLGFASYGTSRIDEVEKASCLMIKTKADSSLRQYKLTPIRLSRLCVLPHHSTSQCINKSTQYTTAYTRSITAHSLNIFSIPGSISEFTSPESLGYSHSTSRPLFFDPGFSRERIPCRADPWTPLTSDCAGLRELPYARRCSDLVGSPDCLFALETFSMRVMQRAGIEEKSSEQRRA